MKITILKDHPRYPTGREDEWMNLVVLVLRVGKRIVQVCEAYNKYMDNKDFYCIDREGWENETPDEHDLAALTFARAYFRLTQ